MPIPISPVFTPVPDPLPQRGQIKSVFTPAFNNFISWTPGFQQNLEDAVAWMEGVGGLVEGWADEAEQAAVSASQSKDMSEQAATTATEQATIAVNAVAALPEGTIDDTVIAPDKAWSSQKISDELAALSEGTINDTVIAPDKTWSSQKISDELATKTTFDYVESFPPSVDTNPAKANPLWLDTATGEVFVCVDNTVDANVWAGQYGNKVEPETFDDGSAIDGRTYAAMVSAGNYDASTDTGYFGEVSSATLMTGDALASDIGLTVGTSQHSSEGWLKFYVGANADCNYYKRLGLPPKPYVIYIAKKPYRHTVSWDAIYARGAVYGSGDTGVTPTGTPTLQDASVTKSGKTLSVRLMTGVDTDPMDFYNKGCAANVGGKSEWNQLFYRIHTDIPTCPAANNFDGGPQIGGNWANFTNSDLVVGTGNGRYAWTQETLSASPSARALRGLSRVSYLYINASAYTGSLNGWRPALVLGA